MRVLITAFVCGVLSACTLQHSKQAIFATVTHTPSKNATFITEEDSGVSLLGLWDFSEPDHFVVLYERMRRRYKCSEIHSLQLDFYTDHWLIVGFPIARLTAVCEPPGQAPKPHWDPMRRPPPPGKGKLHIEVPPGPLPRSNQPPRPHWDKPPSPPPATRPHIETPPLSETSTTTK